jgi:hypothetical protein
MEHQSDEDIASTTTASTRKKSRSQTQSLSERMAKNWPFTRVDPKLLERAHRQAIKKPDLSTAEEAPF